MWICLVSATTPQTLQAVVRIKPHSLKIWAWSADFEMGPTHVSPSAGVLSELFLRLLLSHGSCEHRSHWFSKLDVWEEGACPSDTNLEIWATQIGFSNLLFLWVKLQVLSSSWLWVITPGVEFMVRLCPSLYYLLWCRFLLLCLVCSHWSAGL